MEFLKTAGRKLKALHEDEQGADLIEYVLIIAAIALPLLAVIIWFKDDIVQWIGEAYEGVKSGEGGTDPLE
jgi:Flp pilus assembly pilin Flp